MEVFREGVGVKELSKHRIFKQGTLAVLLGTAALVLSGCNLHTGNKWVDQTLNFGFPTGVTPEATAIREFWTIVVITSLIVGIFVWGLIFWTTTFHRRKADSEEFPRQTGYNITLEIIYTAIPFVIVAVLFFFTAAVQHKVLELRPEEEIAVRVDVTGYQWNWKFGYNKAVLDGLNIADGYDKEAMAAAAEASARDEEELESAGEGAPRGPVHGKFESDLGYLQHNEIETLGSSEEVPVLVLPTDHRIEFRQASADVVHSFWVPEFLFKLDVMPHPEKNQQLNLFQIEKIERTGAFVGRCTEMCGTYHGMMNFEVRAVEPAKFVEYMKFREANPDATNAEALKSIGEEPYAISTKPFKTGRADTRDGDINYVDTSNK